MRNNYPGQSTLQYKARPMGYAEMLQQREKARGEEGKLFCVYLLLIVGDVRLGLFDMNCILLFCVCM